MFQKELISKTAPTIFCVHGNHEMNPDSLYVAEIIINQGPTMKRWRAGAQGRASMILKRSSHVSVTLRESD